MTNLLRSGGSSPKSVTVQDAAIRTGDATGRGGDALLRDVREPYEWQAGHAPCAVHLPLRAPVPGCPPRRRPGGPSS